MRYYEGLKNLKKAGHNNIYCPKCGNILTVVNNGWFNGELFYCKEENKIFRVSLIDITKKGNERFLEQCKLFTDIEEARKNVNSKNYKNLLTK